ncbi:tryptase beta-2 [Nephila pilipes]|uniref:Tryptase beta-2 n=1 Tax=Nephila pilipes TaxID=299642 RepID=A0A8X6K055_NEPPI|nr:tryptase beta-2 [Nephila pilipes]
MQQVSAHNCMKKRYPSETVKQFHCAVGTNQSTCLGDSGSSNFIKFNNRFYTLGVTSGGLLPKKLPRQCYPGFFARFSKVLYFSKWIEMHVKDLPEP